MKYIKNKKSKDKTLRNNQKINEEITNCEAVAINH